MSAARVVIDVADGIAHVRLNRPEKRNAFDPAMFTACVDATTALRERTDVRCVVLSGEGDSFCAGLDFSQFEAMAGAGGDAADSDSIGGNIAKVDDAAITHQAQQAVWGFTELSVPVICAVQGHALGAGLQLALGADVRIAHPDAKLAVLEIRWGLVPDMCATVLLPPLVGPDLAKLLTWTGRMVSGTEAKEIGLVTAVAEDPVAAAIELATDIASKNPDAIRRGKDMLSATTAPGPEASSLADAFAAERHNMGSLIGSANQVEATMAFFEKRPPVFADND